MSWEWVHTLVQRYLDEGESAFEARSTGPHSNPSATDEFVRGLIIELRHDLTAQGLDAGPVTIVWHLKERGLTAPSTSTIRRILTDDNLVTPEPKKRPKSSLRRFEAAQPNECWQSDFPPQAGGAPTRWALADGTDVEILNWLDDHSRLLLACTLFARVTGDDVVDVFTHTANEYLPATLRIVQKNGHPGHPQTQAKIERFHQTLKKWLHRQPAAETLGELQSQLDLFRSIYNTQRPHRALKGSTRWQAYQATIKARPTAEAD